MGGLLLDLAVSVDATSNQGQSAHGHSRVGCSLTPVDRVPNRCCCIHRCLGGLGGFGGFGIRGAVGFLVHDISPFGFVYLRH